MFASRDVEIFPEFINHLILSEVIMMPGGQDELRFRVTQQIIVLFLIENYRNSFEIQNDFRADRHVRICNTIMRVRRDDYLFTLTASC